MLKDASRVLKHPSLNRATVVGPNSIVELELVRLLETMTRPNVAKKHGRWDKDSVYKDY